MKSLSISDFWLQSCRRRSVLLSLVSSYCHNLVELEVKNAWLSVENLSPMPMLTSLTLESVRLDDKLLVRLNKCFPNLKFLNLIGVSAHSFQHQL
ncbi:F-box/RNI-like superfamily protein [Artemisia annua]|uniref:F-box/RNI-like superfamily protein n=1 Tax=Artemisia annua TaxID=35608 RepID=A0A2U1KTM2_ARTAN|nr:F-box/RNI-like superfamily protein [Artemisia annua]